MAMVDDDNNIISDSSTGNEVGDDGDGITGDDNDKDDTSCEATTNRRRLLRVATVSPSGESSHSFRCCAVSAKGHHSVFFTPSFGSLSATVQRATKSTKMVGDGITSDVMGSSATGYDNDDW